jgi:hypothetical protein
MYSKKQDTILKDLDTSIDLSIYENANNDIKASITYYKDNEDFEKTHLKIIHPPMDIGMVRGIFELHSREGSVQSYQDMKATVKTDFSGKETI